MPQRNKPSKPDKHSQPSINATNWHIGPIRFIRFLAGPILLFLAVALVYGHATNAPFIFDDSESVQKNTSIVRLWPLVGDSQHPGPLNPVGDLPVSGRPLANLSLALNFCFGQ